MNCNITFKYILISKNSAAFNHTFLFFYYGVQSRKILLLSRGRWQNLGHSVTLKKRSSSLLFLTGIKQNRQILVIHILTIVEDFHGFACFHLHRLNFLSIFFCKTVNRTFLLTYKPYSILLKCL